MKWLYGMLACPAIALAAGGPTIPSPPTVSQVTIEGAPAAFPLETKAGEPLDETKIRHDVKAIYTARRPFDVRVEELPDGGASPAQGVSLIFHVEQRRTVMLRKVTMDPPTAGINMGVGPGQQIDAETAQRTAIEVRKQLIQSGFVDAKVGASLTPTPDGKADLLLSIEKGRAVNVNAITFSGELGVKEKDLRGALRATKPTTILPRVPGLFNGWRILRGYNDDAIPADIGNLRSFYYSRGFFDAHVTASSADAGAKAHVDFDVASGPRYAVHEFTMSGPDGEKPIGAPKLPGESIRGQMGAACDALLAERRKYERTGVVDFEARIEVNEVPAPEGANTSLKWADLRATIAPGRAYETGRITFMGNHKFSESVLRGALTLDEGAPLDEMKLRKSLVRLNQTGFFEPLSERDVLVNTPPKGPANVTIWVREKKARNWSFSGPVGPLSLGGPLEFSLGSRLPAWGRGALDLSTYMISMRLFYFAKPIGALIPFLPNQRFVPLLTISRPLLPGQTLLSGVTIAPQLGWQGMLLGYGASQLRNLTRGIFDSDRGLTPPLPVTIISGQNQGTMMCVPRKTGVDWIKQISGTVINVGFSFFPI